MGLRLRENPGKHFQALADSSALRTCFVLPLPQIGAKRIPGGKLVPERMPFDRIVVHRATGRAICFDCKTTADHNAFAVGHEDHVPSHQRRALISAGSEGVLSGLLIEARHPDVAAVFWLHWKALIAVPASLPWCHNALVKLCDYGVPIDFDVLVSKYPARREVTCGRQED